MPAAPPRSHIHAKAHAFHDLPCCQVHLARRQSGEQRAGEHRPVAAIPLEILLLGALSRLSANAVVHPLSSASALHGRLSLFLPRLAMTESSHHPAEPCKEDRRRRGLRDGLRKFIAYRLKRDHLW